MKKIVAITTSLVASLVLSGCGNSEDSTTCEFDVQSSLDKKEYSKVKELLAGECSDTFSVSDKSYTLALAYMGESGYAASDVIQMLIDAGNDDDAFVSFTKKVDDKKESGTIVALEKAKELFADSIDNKASTDDILAKCNEIDQNPKASSREKNACAYLGFNRTLTTAATVSYLTNDIDSAMNAIASKDDSDNGEEKATTPLDLKASLDALEWASNEEITNGSEITEKDITIANKAYKALTVKLEGKTFYRLAEENAPAEEASTVLTSGYCDKNANKENCNDIENTDGSIKDTEKECYACPIIGSENETLKVSDTLVDSINDGKDAILATIDDEDVRDSIDKFIDDISDSDDEEKEITMEDIINYLNNK